MKMSTSQLLALDPKTILATTSLKKVSNVPPSLICFQKLNRLMHFPTLQNSIQLISCWNPLPEHFNSLNDHKLYILFAL